MKFKVGDKVFYIGETEEFRQQAGTVVEKPKREPYYDETNRVWVEWEDGQILQPSIEVVRHLTKLDKAMK